MMNLNPTVSKTGMTQIISYYRSALVEIEPRYRYAAIDADTHRDGSYHIPQEGQERLRTFLQSRGIKRFIMNQNGARIERVPLEIAADVAHGIAEIAEEYRDCCSYSMWRTMHGRRAPLVGWIDRRGRPIESPSMPDTRDDKVA